MIDNDVFEAEADLEEALLRYFRVHGVPEFDLVADVELAFQELDRQVRDRV